MKRYTAILIPGDSNLEEAQVKTVVEQALLRARRPLTFRLGKAGLDEQGRWLVELESGESKAALAQALAGLEPGGWRVAALEEAGAPRTR